MEKNSQNGHPEPGMRACHHRHKSEDGLPFPEDFMGSNLYLGGKKKLISKNKNA